MSRSEQFEPVNPDEPDDWLGHTPKWNLEQGDDVDANDAVPKLADAIRNQLPGHDSEIIRMALEEVVAWYLLNCIPSTELTAALGEFVYRVSHRIGDLD
jgi:hypothetical protein